MDNTNQLPSDLSHNYSCNNVEIGSKLCPTSIHPSSFFCLQKDWKEVIMPHFNPNWLGFIPQPASATSDVKLKLKTSTPDGYDQYNEAEDTKAHQENLCCNTPICFEPDERSLGLV